MMDGSVAQRSANIDTVPPHLTTAAAGQLFLLRPRSLDREVDNRHLMFAEMIQFFLGIQLASRYLVILTRPIVSELVLTASKPLVYFST